MRGKGRDGTLLLSTQRAEWLQDPSRVVCRVGTSCYGWLPAEGSLFCAQMSVIARLQESRAPAGENRLPN